MTRSTSLWLAGLTLAVSVASAGCGGGSPAAPDALTTSSQDQSKTTEAREKRPKRPLPPAVGEELASVSQNGRVNVITSGEGFTIVDSLLDLATETDESILTTYDMNGEVLARLSPGSFTGECGAADVDVPGGGRMIFTEQTGTKPAQGIVPASGWTELEAWEAENGQPVWHTRVYDEAAGCTAYDGQLEGFVSTPDGQWGLVALSEGGWVVDLSSGQLRKDPRAVGIIGNYVVDAVGDNGELFQLTDPATGAGFGKISSDANVKDSVSFYSNLDFAPSGVFEDDGSGMSPPAGTSADGERMIAIRNDGGGIAEEGGRVTIYSLPSAEILWEASLPESGYLEGDGGGVLVMREEDCRGEYGCIVGLDDETGKRLWKLPDGGVCAMSESQMVLEVNGQLAVIDLETGKQVSYSEETECPTVLPGGIGVSLDSGELLEAEEVTVTQALEP